jgi:hypothetical protein
MWDVFIGMLTWSLYVYLLLLFSELISGVYVCAGCWKWTFIDVLCVTTRQISSWPLNNVCNCNFQFYVVQMA